MTDAARQVSEFGGRLKDRQRVEGLVGEPEGLRDEDKESGRCG